jgi:large subunit ribosomal protein L29
MAEEKHRQILERLRGLSDRELAEELDRMRARLFDQRRQNTTRQLENVASIRQTKKQIARILTLQQERATAANEG